MSLAPSGERKIEWAWRNMPLLRQIGEDFEREQPFKGLKIALSVHMEAKTACLCRTLARGGAQMFATGCNVLSTQDDVAAAVASGGIEVFAVHGVSPEGYEEHLCRVLENGPNIIIDDGGDLLKLMHTRFTDLIPNVIGGCEETTTGITRIRSMLAAGELKYPIVAVNEADCKHLFDNRYGSGQSVWDGINRTTNLVVAGKYVVVAGYGMCGRGVAMRADGLGAKVIITEVDPVRALEAFMDGYEVMTMDEAAGIGDVFITVTGCSDIIRREHMERMKPGAILCNAGHFNVEVDVDALAEMSTEIYEARNNITGYVRADGTPLFLLGEGRLVNLAAGDGHPVEIMDMSFAIQALCSRYLAEHRGQIATTLLPVPAEIDREVARRKLKTLGVSIDSLSERQEQYIASW